MPSNYVDKLVSMGKGSKADLEKKWDEAKKQAAKAGHTNDYDYITGIFKKMVGESILEWTISDVQMAMKKKHGKVDKDAIAKLKKMQRMGNVTRADLEKIGYGDLIVEDDLNVVTYKDFIEACKKKHK